MIKNSEEEWDGEQYDTDLVDTVEVPSIPYVARYSLMESPDHLIPTDDDGFRQYPAGYPKNSFLSIEYAIRNVPDGFRGATLREVIFMKQKNTPYQSSFFALSTTMEGSVPVVYDNSRTGLRLGLASPESTHSHPDFAFPLIKLG